MKLIIILISLNAYVLAAEYVDMSDVISRADDLSITVQNYEYLMGLAGIALGFTFNLFLWKVR